jgi:hypothetical protein
MKVTEGDLLAWDVVSRVIGDAAPEEVDVLPDIAESVLRRPPTIGNTPAAFDATVVSSVAASAFLLIVSVLTKAVPKLFEASVDIGKEYFKTRFAKAALPPPAAPPKPAADLAGIRQAIIDAGARYRLSTATSLAVADAVVSHLALISIPKNQP